MSTRAACIVLLTAAALAGLLVADAISTGVKQQTSDVPRSIRPVWTEVKWPFPLDQWGFGRAFVCRAADCGGEVNLYLRPKLGFCNCTTGVSDDAELDRVGDLELLSTTFDGLGDGRPIAVGWMSGRSRPYFVTMRYAPPVTAVAIGFNDKCDVAVVTVVAEREQLSVAERHAVEFLNSDVLLRWVEKELGL